MSNLPDNQQIDEDLDFIIATHPPKEVVKLIKTYCYNCHSTQTQYPAIARYAPFDKPYIHPVRRGREELNFSIWNHYPPENQKILLLNAVEQLANRSMPIESIFPQGSDTLSQAEYRLLMGWLAQEAEAGMK